MIVNGLNKVRDFELFPREIVMLPTDAVIEVLYLATITYCDFRFEYLSAKTLEYYYRSLCTLIV